ncbi:unnamed protein product, partial [Didymodactylos carnosus]
MQSSELSSASIDASNCFDITNDGRLIITKNLKEFPHRTIFLLNILALSHLETQTPIRTTVIVYLAETNDRINVNIRWPQSRLENDLQQHQQQQSSAGNFWTNLENITNTMILVNKLTPYNNHDSGRIDQDQTKANIYMINRRTNMLLDNLQAYDLLMNTKNDLLHFHPKKTEKEIQHLLKQSRISTMHWAYWILIILSILIGLCFTLFLLWHCCRRPDTRCKYMSPKPNLFRFLKMKKNVHPLFDDSLKMPMPQSPPFPITNRAKDQLRTIPLITATTASPVEREDNEPLLSTFTAAATALLAENRLSAEQSVPRATETQ